jgi:maleylacetate reductase
MSPLRCGMAGPLAPGEAGHVLRDFVHECAPARVVFGSGGLDRVPDETAALGLHRVLVIAGGSATSPGQRVVARLGSRAAGQLTLVAPHVPEQLVAAAVAEARSTGADGLCSIGGGSATGLAKATAVALDLPIVAVPTTYAGSEATSVYGVTGTRKRTASDPRVRPRTVIYDAALTTALPARATATSAFNALAHATAALAGPAYEPVACMYAAEAIRLVNRALPVAVQDPTGLEARGDLLWAAWLAGSSLSATGAGLHHRLCHVLGGSFGLVHAEAHAVLLPNTTARDPDLDRDRLAAALGVDDPVAALRDLAQRVGIPTGLAAIGMPADRLDTAAGEAAKVIGRHDISWFRDLLDEAYHDRERTST